MDSDPGRDPDGGLARPRLPGIADIERARERIGPHLRRTPLVAAGAVRLPPYPRLAPSRLLLKLESLQVTGSFKARGAVNKLLSLPAGEAQRGLVTASGGNHGVAVAYAGWLAGSPSTIFFPRPTDPEKIESARRWGARVVVGGEVWDEANEAATEEARRSGRAYVHAFADPVVVAGQGTIGLELLDDRPDLDCVLVAIGGGGLIGGVATALRARRPSIRVVGVEPEGAPTLRRSLDAGRLVELESVATAARTLAPRRSAQINLDLVRALVDDVVLVSDEEMRAAARWLWLELGVAAELSGAAALAALHHGRVPVAEGETVGVLVCGAGRDGL